MTEYINDPVAPKYVDDQGKSYDKLLDGYHVAKNQDAKYGTQLIFKDQPTDKPTAEFVTRTILIELPSGKTKLIRQKVMKGHQFGKVKLPVLDGYQAEVTGGKLDDLTADKDCQLRVKFVED